MKISKDVIDEHDMTKKMLDIMRNGKKSNLIVEEEDATKKMLSTIRNGFKLITEDEVGQQAPSSVPQPNSAPSESEDLSSEQLQQEEKAFMDSVSPKVDFRELKVYRKEQNVVFSGVFQDMGGMEWVMSLKDADGLTISAQSLKIDNDSIAILNKLHGYYVNWSKDWAVRVHTDFQYNNK